MVLKESTRVGNCVVFPIRQKGGEMKIFDPEINSMKRRIHELAKQAEQIRNDHYNWHLRENAPLAPRDKGRLTLRVRERKGGLEISWSHFRFIKREGYSKSSIRSEGIPKGRAHMYRHHSLAVRGKPWEMERVWEVEQQLAQIRSEYADVRKALTALKRMQQKALARGDVARPDTKNSKTLGQGDAVRPDQNSLMEAVQ